MRWRTIAAITLGRQATNAARAAEATLIAVGVLECC
jgi:hypothetical protein